MSLLRAASRTLSALVAPTHTKTLIPLYQHASLKASKFHGTPVSRAPAGTETHEPGRERLALDRLTVMQAGLRSPEELVEMKDYVENGGIFNLEKVVDYAAHHDFTYVPTIVRLSRFENDPEERLYVHDGHHRVAGIHLANRGYLEPEEYCVSSFTFEQYNAINWEDGWLTPHDPRHEIRVADFWDFKDNVLRILDTKGRDAATQFILEHRNVYCQPRDNIYTIEDLIRECRFPDGSEIIDVQR